MIFCHVDIYLCAPAAERSHVNKENMTKSCSKAPFVVLSPEPKLAATGQDGSGWPPDWPIARPSYSKLSYCTKKDQVMKMRCNLAVAQSCPINCVLSNLPSQKPSKQIAFVRKQTTNSGKRIWCQNTSLSSQDFPCCSSSSPTLQKTWLRKAQKLLQMLVDSVEHLVVLPHFVTATAT